MPGKIRHIIITLAILGISSILVDEGRAIMLIHNTIEIEFNHDHRDLDIPHQQNFNGSAQDEELLSLNSFTLSHTYKILFLSTHISDTGPQDYAGLIWQPPKSE
jgi:hypothetical protein